MKFIKREKSRSTFLIGKKEREMLNALLLRYPLVIASHFRNRNSNASEDTRSNDDLIEEALAEQQKENRRALEKMLAEPGRFVENDLGYSFKLSDAEIEWLLQVLNDIRVGSWIQLGEPDSSSLGDLQPTEQNIQLAWSMEMAGLFQHSLLEAGNPAD